MQTIIATTAFVVLAAATLTLMLGIGVTAWLSRPSVKSLREDR